MTRVLGVHGIGKYRYLRANGQSLEAASKAISADWSAWLGADSAHQIRVAFYSHHLHRGTPQGSDDPANLDAAEQELLVSWVEQLLPSGAIAQGPKTAKVRQAADWLTCNFGSAARAFAMAFAREVQTYLSEHDSVRRSKTRLTLANAIAEHRPDVLIAHSLGSVVAYETLWAYPHQKINLLVTVGSPLAMPGVVLNRLQPDAISRRGARPPGVTRWVNIADIGDIVALPRGGLAPYFDGVDEDAEVVIGDWDFHTIRNYLGCVELRQLLRFE